MKNCKITVGFLTLEQYMDATGYASVEEVLHSTGVVAEEYACAYCWTQEGEYVDRVFAPVMHNSFAQAMERCTQLLMGSCVHILRAQ